MGVTSEILGNSGAPHQIEHAGKVYKLRLIDQVVQSAWEKRLYEKDCHAAKIQNEVGLLTPEKYAARIDELTEAYRNGDYEMMSEVGVKNLSKKSGAMLLLSLVVDCSQLELANLMNAKPVETLKKIRLIISEAFPDLKLPEINEKEIAALQAKAGAAGAAGAVSTEPAAPN